MKCPVCGTVYRPSKASSGAGEAGGNEVVSSSSPLPSCRRCKADLSDLFRLHDQAVWYHKQALHFLTQGRYSEAREYNNRSLALYYNNADFHALAGKLSALQGEFREAVLSWQRAIEFDPQNPVACHCLQAIELMAQDYQKNIYSNPI